MTLFDESLFDDNFIYSVKRLAKGLELPPALVVQNIVLAKLARDAAHDDVYGGGGNLFIEFMAKTDEEGETHLMTGAELFSAIYEMEKKKLETEYIEKLQQIPWEALREEQKELMKKYGQDPESKDKQEQDKADIQALIDSGDLVIGETTWNGEE